MPVVWRLIDGKAGHERQTAGFAKALSHLCPCEIIDIAAPDIPAIRGLLFNRFPKVPSSPPDIIVGAGRLCEIAMLALNRTFGGRTIYFMRPRLPTRLFDLCVIPRHDRPAAAPHVMITEGVVNDLQPTSPKVANSGVILIGGPSKHHRWHEQNLLEQVNQLITHNTHIRFKLTPSRRTPVSTQNALRRLKGIDFFGLEAISQQWLPKTLAESEIAWVTKDSISMIYEALSCGAKVGLLDVPIKREGRISRVADDLEKKAMVTNFAAWESNFEMHDSPTLAEAERVARWVSERWRLTGESHS